MDEEVALHLSKIYLTGFSNPGKWTPEQHLEGLKAVYLAGAKAQKKKEAV